MMWLRVSVAVVALLIVFSALSFVSINDSISTVLKYNCSVVKFYPHDTNSFTEGLVFDDGFLYESTGLYGNSSLRRVDLLTGKVNQQVNLQPQYFAEGIAVVGDEIVQLTWQSHLGFVYDKTSFRLLKQFQYPTEGWGLTYDGKDLIMSDGTANLYFLDPVSFRIIRHVTVHDSGPITMLNELEYVNGTIYANIWMQEKIAVINAQNGEVLTWINLTGIQELTNHDQNNVLNGIAYDTAGHRLFVTGKMWPHIFEIILTLLT
jgi:glutamine cyclotransferase